MTLDEIKPLIRKALKNHATDVDRRGLRNANTDWHAGQIVGILLPLINDAEKQKKLVYKFKFAIAGGEDAPGAAHALTLEQAQEYLTEKRRQWYEDQDTIERLREDCGKLRKLASDMLDAIDRGVITSQEIKPVPGDGPPYWFHEEWSNRARRLTDEED